MLCKCPYTATGSANTPIHKHRLCKQDFKQPKALQTPLHGHRLWKQPYTPSQALQTPLHTQFQAVQTARSSVEARLLQETMQRFVGSANTSGHICWGCGQQALLPAGFLGYSSHSLLWPAWILAQQLFIRGLCPTTPSPTCSNPRPP